MLNSKNIFQQVRKLTENIISSGLCVDQNYPSITNGPNNLEYITISNYSNSICLKNIPYKEMYAELLRTRAFNLKMVDGALITLQYKFVKNEIISHRLSFFPSINLESFQNEPEIYLNDELYLDIIDKRTVSVPLRFDYDSGEAFIPLIHPKSHLTIGQYKNCRIPVTSAITPYQFLSFILNNFYKYSSERTQCKLTKFSSGFSQTIHELERKVIHISIPE